MRDEQSTLFSAVDEGQERSSDKDTKIISYTVDSFADGIAFGQHKLEKDDDPREFYDLKLSEEGEVSRLRSRYALHKNNPFWELERYLVRLSRQGLLGTSTIYFGTSTDPFHPFEGKFDASMKFLQLFERYTPGMLVVQTRSPLIVLTMPILKKLGKRAAVTIAIETPLEESVKKYTPHLPRVEERLRVANALRRLGVEVSLQVSPLLPYGDWKADADAFAEVLDTHGDYIHLASLSTDNEAEAKRRARSELAKKLAQERKFQWLRADAAQPLYDAIEKRCPDKLKAPCREHLRGKQIGIFAA